MTAMPKIDRQSLMPLEAYARNRNEFRAKAMAHKKNRTLHLGEAITLAFEDELTVRYQVQEMLRIEEPFITASIMSPTEYVGPILSLCQEKRGVHKGIEYLKDARVVVAYELPLNEIVLDFYDRLKS
ncbi:MAG: DUF3501 family protein, partial [Betaproteobacteria bacterium]|nr:DUF3501 family protein [Betaproteobacteria bacterium]